ncbi:amino acid permease [Trichoderma harzianum]|uniref:Amino acid permease n=1 Tax=Trichoderma harzianum TaxID=5544 RepID=A0A0F9ZTB6_TRIHA|nr:amino acid permease [Trichoderma harzianum]
MSHDLHTAQIDAEDGLAPPVSSDCSRDKEKGLDQRQSAASFQEQENSPTEQPEQLKRHLQGRHVQMIAIGGAIGAGLFVGAGSALSAGGPASLLISFIVVGIMMYLMMQALTELAVLYPVNGAFYTYIVRFIDPSWGFAIGAEYAFQWLCLLPFEITAAGITISFWRDDINIGVWIAVFLVTVSLIQLFGVPEFVLSMIKMVACMGFIILGIIINCGGVPTDDRGYIGARYWHDPGAFRNGFKGFCSVFVTASFAFGGTEMTGLAAAETADPRKQIPKAAKQVFFRIAFFYVVNLFILGLIVPSDSDVLLGSSGANTKASPFVLAIELAGIKVLPTIFNVVITISVLSVANSAMYASTRTFQAMAMYKMMPSSFGYVDSHGRPVVTITLQILFGLLAFINEKTSSGEVLFSWLLALTGVSWYFIYGSICVAHIRFRSAWKLNGHTPKELPHQATFGVWGSYVGVFLNFICLCAQIYTALWPPSGASPNAKTFFNACLALLVILALYIFWKVYSWFKHPEQRPMYVKIKDIDVYADIRDGWNAGSVAQETQQKKGAAGYLKSLYHILF